MSGQDHTIDEISPTELRERLESARPTTLLDVREAHEREIADLPETGQLRIPMRELAGRIDELDPADELVVYCRTGARSRWVVGQLLERGFGKVYNLKGGVMGWRDEVDPTLEEY